MSACLRVLSSHVLYDTSTRVNLYETSLIQVPETRGKTLEEITADLASSSPPSLPGSRGLVAEGGPRHVPLAGSDEEAD